MPTEKEWHAEALRLRVEQNLPGEEIARRLGQGRSTVQIYLQRSNAPPYKRVAPAWHDDVVRLFNEGVSSGYGIAKIVGRAESTVRAILHRRGLRIIPAEGKPKNRDYYGMPTKSMTQCEPHKYRTPKEAIPREIIREACLAFAENRITRAELMRRITPGPQ